MKLTRSLLRAFSTPGGYRSYGSTSLPKLLTAKRDPNLIVDQKLISKINHILETVSPIEPELELLVHRFSPRVVSSVLQNPPSPQLGFRFFIWATRRRWLRTWQLHHVIVYMLGEVGGFDLYWKTLEELRGSNVSIPSDAFLVLFLAYSEAGSAEKAVEAFGRMRHFNTQPNVYAYNGIMYVMVKKDVLLLASAVYNQMLKSNCSPNVATYSILIDGLCKGGMTQDALKLFDEMAERNIYPNNVTYSIVLCGLCQAKRVDDAQVFLNKMVSSGECPPDKITFNTLLNGFCKVGRMDEAFMLLTSFQSDAYALGIKGYSCIIDGLFRAGRLQEANKWFQKFCSENARPDVVLYTIMIRGYSEAGKVEDALQFLREMTERGLVPDTQCYNTLIRGYCKLGLLDNARSLKLEISEKGCLPDACTYTILICGMCEEGLIDEAEEIFKEMEKLGCSPSVVTFNALIHGLCEAGNLEEAHLLCYKMEVGTNPSLFLQLSQGPDRVRDTSSLQRLVERLCDSGSYLKAYEILTKLADNVVPNIFTYNVLINGMCKSGNIDKAHKILKKLKHEGPSPDSVTYSTLIDGLCRVGREEDALRMLDQETHNGSFSGSSPYKSLMTWLSRKGKVSMTFTLWLMYLRSIHNRDDAALKLITEHLERGEVVKAVKDLVELDFKLKDFDLGIYTIWIIGFCQANKVEDAFKIFCVLEDHKVNVTAPSCVMLIRCLCREGKLDLAMDVFLYTLGNGLMLKHQICNYLLESFMSSESHRKYVVDLVRRMEVGGYDVDSCVYPATKLLLERFINSAYPIMETQEIGPQLLASPG